MLVQILRSEFEIMSGRRMVVVRGQICDEVPSAGHRGKNTNINGHTLKAVTALRGSKFMGESS